MTDKDKPNTGAAQDGPGASNSSLRDARLAQALRHMPDAHMQPGAQARLTVLRHAQEAVAGESGGATPNAQRWWQWLLGTPGSRRGSHAAWGGALASVLVASFITLMWYGQPVPDANPDMPTATGKAESAAPASPPATAVEQATHVEPPMTALLKQDTLKETRKPAAPKAAELPPPPFIPPPEVQLQVQAVAAPPPTPAPMPPPPAAGTLQTAPTGGLLADAAPAARARADIPQVRMSAAPAPMAKARNEFIDIHSDGTHSRAVRRVPVNQAEALLAYLRDLRDLRTPTPQTAGQVPEQTVSATADSSPPPITIRTPQGERWEIWPTQVRVQTATALKADAAAPLQVIAITAAQYENLRSLIKRTTAP